MSQNSNSLSQLALRKFKKNFWGVFSLVFIGLVGLISIFSYVLAPDDSQYANQMHLAIHSKKPRFSVQMLIIPQEANTEQSFLSTIFFGKKNVSTEIPISEYSKTNNALRYTEYAGDGLVGLAYLFIRYR